MRFVEFSVKTDSDKTELVAYFVEQLTNQGVAIIDGKDLSVETEFIDDKLKNELDNTCVVKGFCTLLKSYSIIKKIKAKYFQAFGEIPTVTRTVKNDKTYLSEYKKWEKPIKIGNITISPTKIEENCLIIDSVLAFGNGHHETTALCVQALQTINCQNKKVLDVGCGSGVLGFCALILNASSLTACDYDKEAVKAANHNAKVNNLTNYRIFQNDMLKGIKERFDIVMANITTDILTPHASDFSQVVAENGYLLLSGMLNSQTERVKSAFCEYFEVETQFDKGEWSALLLRRKA